MKIINFLTILILSFRCIIMLQRSARKRKASSLPYSTVVAASRKKPTSSAVANTVNSANLVSYPLLYNLVPVSVSSSSPYNSIPVSVSCSSPYNSIPVSVSSSSPYNSVPVSLSSLIGSMGVSANITSLPQPAPIMWIQTTDHSTDQVPPNTTTLGSNTGNNTYLPIQIGSSLDQMHTPHGIASGLL